MKNDSKYLDVGATESHFIYLPLRLYWFIKPIVAGVASGVLAVQFDWLFVLMNDLRYIAFVL